MEMISRGQDGNFRLIKTNPTIKKQNRDKCKVFFKYKQFFHKKFFSSVKEKKDALSSILL
jgi:hypothetical protein